MQKLILCQTKTALLHGRIELAPEVAVSAWKRLFGLHRQGTYTHFEPVAVDIALQAFDRFLASPGNFSIEASDHLTIDFAACWKENEIWLDIWGSNIDLSEAVVTAAAAREIVQFIYSDITDATLIKFIRAHALSTV